MDRTLATWDPEVAKARRAAPAGLTLAVSGDNCQITDCNVYSDGDGCRLQYCTNSIFARNTIYEPLAAGATLGQAPDLGGQLLHRRHQRDARRGIYFARNHIQHVYAGFRELMTTDTGGGCYVGKLAAVNGTELTTLDDLNWQGGRDCLVVMSGAGMGQYRLITKKAGKNFTIDRPFDVQPDENSIVAITVWMNHLMWVDNSMADGSSGIGLYGTAYDCLIAGNTAARSTGFELLGFNYGGPAPEFYIQMLNNRITEGYGMKGPGSGDGWSAILLRSDGQAHVNGTNGYTYNGPMIRGVVVRGNTIDNNSGISVFRTASDVVVERNMVRDARGGLT